MFVLAALLLLLAAVAVFASQNAHMVAVNLLGWQLTWPLAGVVLISLVAGALVAFLIGLARQLSLRLKMRDANARLRKAEGDLSAAKSELDKAKAELERLKAALLVAQQELEEARRAAHERGREGSRAGAEESRGGGLGGPRRGGA